MYTIFQMTYARLFWAFRHDMLVLDVSLTIILLISDALAEAFSDLAQKSPELQEEFLYNAETQRNLTKNGETLLNAINFFISSVNTLCNKTIEDSKYPLVHKSSF